MNRYLTTTCLLLIACFTSVSAQTLDQTFARIFDRILIDDFQQSGTSEFHRDHYLPAAADANQNLIPALNGLIANNVSSFPLSSTVAGVLFDFSSGQPVSVRESLGPIFAETARTLGGGKYTAGFNATYLSLDHFRGVPLDDLHFTFPHEDIGEPGLGDNQTEVDLIHLDLGLDVNASIYAFSATYGLTNNLDFGIAVPLINITTRGEAVATIESYTLYMEDQFGGGAKHFFGGNALSPILTDRVSYDESSTGIGDLAIRLKYRLPFRTNVGLAALFDVRIPTGDEQDFLGTGKANYRVLLIGSNQIGGFTPHVNLGYEYRGAEFDSDEFGFVVGFDQKISTGVTFAFDVLGDIDLNEEQALRFLPLEATINDQYANTGATATRIVSLNNIPDRNNDNTIAASIGFRIAASDWFQMLGNLIAPLNNGGLSSQVIPTVGLTILL